MVRQAPAVLIAPTHAAAADLGSLDRCESSWPSRSEPDSRRGWRRRESNPRPDAAPSAEAATSPGKKLFAERDRFGKWQHVLGPRHVLIAYTVDSPSHGLIRRLELQAHLGDEGEDDLCPTREFAARWGRLEKFIAMAAWSTERLATAAAPTP
jgi:hypothetical protein